MCRMVGAVFRQSFPIYSLNDLRAVSERGKLPGEEEPGHRDGWGIVSFKNGSPLYVGRSDRPAFLDPSFCSALEGVRGLDVPNIVIAHARAASEGGPKLANTHPFIVGRLVFGHNGTIYDFYPKTSLRPKGDTDSERLAVLVAERFDKEGELGSALKSVIKEDLVGAEFSAVIILASDGKSLYGYRDYAKEERAYYYDLRLAKSDSYAAFYQQSFVGYEGEVSQVRKGELVSVNLGLEVRRESLL